jgi:hypothetical protein
VSQGSVLPLLPSARPARPDRSAEKKVDAAEQARRDLMATIMSLAFLLINSDSEITG